MKIATIHRLVLVLLCAALSWVLPGTGAAQVQSVDVRITTGSDDAEEDGLGAVVLTDPSLDLGGAGRRVGLRFPGINIPKNSAIVTAYIEFTADAADSGATIFAIEGDYAENPATFTTASGNISGRDVYADAVSWNVDYNWLNVDQIHQSAELKTIVQKMVNRTGWAPGNAMAFIVTSAAGADVFRRAKSADAGGAKGPKLHIEYTENILDIPVAAGSDDMNHYWASSGSFDTGTVQDFSTSVSIGRSSSSNTNYTGLRFLNVNIPQGSTINNAYVKFKAFSPSMDTTSGATLKIAAEKRIATFTFSATANSINSVGYRATSPSVPRTSNIVTWSNPSPWAVNSFYQTPDIKSIIQELVGQSDWNLGDKSVALFIGTDTGTALRKAYAFGSAGPFATLHVEFTPPAVGSGAPVIDLGGSAIIGQTCTQGLNAGSKSFALTNSGAGTLNYSVAVTYNSGTGWLSLSPPAATGSLGPGAQRTFNLGFNSASLAPGLYEANIKFTDPAAGNSPQIVLVKLQVTAMSTMQCDSLPMYAQQDLFNPAVLLLLDLSSSMNDNIASMDPGTTVASTPNIKALVQKVVDLNAWSAGNNMVFFIERNGSSSEPKRQAVSYDIYSAAAPLLRVRYHSGGGPPVDVAVRVSASNDDGGYGSAIWSASADVYLAKSGVNMGTGLRFANVQIPKNANILEAYIDLTAYQSATGSVALKIKAENSPNAASLNQTGWASRLKFPEEVLWTITEPWTGISITKKIDIAKDVLQDLISDSSISWGFGTWASVGEWGGLAESPKTYTLVRVGCKSWTNDHYAQLYDAIDKATPQDDTPFGPSLDGAWRYFKGLKKDGYPGIENGSFYTPSPCQPKIVINVTDGRGNVPTGLTPEAYIDLVKANTNKLCDENVSVVGIGFGIAADQRQQLQAMAAVANQRGDANPSDDLFAMHAKDASGNAVAYVAETKEQLKAAFKQIMGNLQNASFFGSAPAVSSQVDLSDRVLVSSFNAAERTGDLMAVGKSSSGGWTEVLWRASEKLPDVRKLWTRKNNNNIVAYDSGFLANDHWASGELCTPIADIVNSTPVVVGTPPNYYNFEITGNYKNFMKLYGQGSEKRQTLVYTASNDGLLHAFRLSDGVEEWAFLPPRLHEKLNSVTTDPATNMCRDEYCYKYLLDGSPVVADIQGSFPSNPTGWGTILVVGQGQGGGSYTALDITTGRGFDYTPATKAAKFLWDFTDAELGETWSVPDIERVKVNGSSTQAAWGIYFGSGYAENNNIQPSKEAYLYGLNAATGTALWSVGGSAASKIKLSSNLYKMPYSSYTGPIPTAGWKVGKAGGGATCQYPIKSVDTVNKIIYFEASGAPTCFDSETYFNTFNPSGVGSGNGHYSTKPSAVGQTNNALNSPLVSDFDNDHKADRLYVGDLYGNLYRVSNIGKNETPAVSQLFAFNPMPDSPEKNPIRGKAAGAFADSTSHWIYYGTGRYETPADKTSAVQQYFFGLKDKLASPPTYALGSDMALHQIGAKQTFTLTTGSTVAVRTVTGTNAACKPWAIKLHVPATGASERVFTKPLVVGGIVFFTTFIPDTAACGGDGDTYVFAVDYKTGLPPANPVFDLNGDGKFTDADKVTISGNKVIPVGLYVGRGQGSSPVLFKNTLFITTAAAQGSGASPTGGLHALMVNIPEVKVRVESWKHN